MQGHDGDGCGRARHLLRGEVCRGIGDDRDAHRLTLDRDDVDQAGRSDNHGANAVRRRRDDLVPSTDQVTQLGFANRRRDLDPVPDLALDLDDACHGLLNDERGIADRERPCLLYTSRCV